MNKCHKHFWLIIAWAFGATIQARLSDYGRWEECIFTPPWDEFGYELRMKPGEHHWWDWVLLCMMAVCFALLFVYGWSM